MSGKALWIIITPVYRPAPGGGAIYTDSLARGLSAEGCDVVVLTEGFPGQPALERLAVDPGNVEIRRIFPFRAGRAKRDLLSYAAYAWQNLVMARLPRKISRIAARSDADHVMILIHSSFFGNASVLPFVLSGIRRALPANAHLVVDLRDPKFDESLVPVLSRFDGAVGCSRAISDRLRELLPAHTRVMHIPIPFEPPSLPADEDIDHVLSARGLKGTPFVLNPNGINEEKRYPLMLDVVRAMRRIPGYESAILVTVGRARDWKSRDQRAESEGVLDYQGIVPNNELLALASGAMATMILSEVEGMPRSGLETLAIGKPLLAPNIAEFRDHIPGSVVTSNDPAKIAAQLVELIERKPTERYPLARHDIRTIVHSYIEFERALARNEGATR